MVAGVDTRPRAPQLKRVSARTSALGQPSRLAARGRRGLWCAPPLLLLLLLELVWESASGDWERRGGGHGADPQSFRTRVQVGIREAKEILTETAEAASGFGGVVNWRADPGSAGDAEPQARQGSGSSPRTGVPGSG